MWAGTSWPGRTPHTAMLECSVMAISVTVAFASEKRTKVFGSNVRWFMAMAVSVVPALGRCVGECNVLPCGARRGVRSAGARELERLEALSLPRQEIEHLERQRL